MAGKKEKWERLFGPEWKKEMEKEKLQELTDRLELIPKGSEERREIEKMILEATSIEVADGGMLMSAKPKAPKKKKQGAYRETGIPMRGGGMAYRQRMYNYGGRVAKYKG
tara:strand:- start:97 stop:426 length:330 start_codon:yes stop_codon:yes gene_type:complete